MTLQGVREYQVRMAAELERCYAELRVEFLREQTTTEYISPASRVVYDFVRKDLQIPLNRGVEDHPPLLVQKAEAVKNGTAAGCNGPVTNGVATNGEHAGMHHDNELAIRSRTLGTMAGEIYEAVRRGELHDRIMKYGEENGLWAA